MASEVSNTVDFNQQHERVFQVLPWYVNGSLDGNEERLVKEHLSCCLTCRSELKAHKQLQSLCQEPETCSIESRAGYSALRSRIRGGATSPEAETEEAGRSDGTQVPEQPVASRQRPHASYWMAAAALVAALGLVINQYSAEPGEAFQYKEYRTLSSAPLGAAYEDKGTVVLIVFQENAQPSEINRFFDDLGLQKLASGSDERVVRASVQEITWERDAESLETVLATLRASDLVLFAEPAIVGE